MWPTFFIPGLARFTGDVPLEYAAFRCGTTVAPIDMAVDFPTARAGQCIFFVVYAQYNIAFTDSDAFIEHASDILPLALKGHSVLDTAKNYIPNVYYKFLTSDDLDRTFEFTVDGFLVGPVCVAAFVVPDVHAECPVMTPSTWWPERYASHAICGPVEMPGQDAYVFQVIGYLPTSVTAPATPFQLGEVCGPQDVTLLADEDFGHQGDGADRPTKQYWLGAWKARHAQDENWIAGEEPTNTLNTMNGWTNVGMTRTQSGTHYALLAASGSGRHQMEYEVSLTAGEEYTFAVQISSPDAGFSAPFISIYDPNGDEAGFGFWKDQRNYGGPAGPNFYIDTAADRTTQWHAGWYFPDIDGSPNTAGGWMFIHFKARTSGTHALRIGTTQGNSTLSYTALSIQEERVRVHHAMFRRGFVNPMRVYTPDGAVTDGTGSEMGRAATFNARGFLAATTWSYAWSIVPATGTVPPIRIAHGADTDIDGFPPDTNPLIPRQSLEYGGNHNGSHHLSRPLYPIANGVAGKYYLELKVNTAVASQVIIFGVSPMWRGIANSDPITSLTPVYSYEASGVASGDVYGMTVDFDAHEVKFYKNNSLVATRTMTDNYQSGGNDEADMPMVIQCASFGSRQFGWHAIEWKLKDGTFTYSPPSGFIEADYLS